MVTDFVRDDIGAGEFARRVQLALHVLVELQVDVDFAWRVAGTVERSHRGTSQTTGRLDPASEQNQRWLFVLLSGAAKKIVPNNFGIAQNRSGEFRQFLLGGVRWPMFLLLLWLPTLRIE